VLVPADFIMSRQMLRGVAVRAERTTGADLARLGRTGPADPGGDRRGAGAGRGEASRPLLQRLIVPLGNPGPGRYRPPPRLYARMQWLGHFLTDLGGSPGYVVTLEVPGRR